MTGDDSMSDDVFEEDAPNTVSTGLTPGTTGQTSTTTPSPTGYRDYKPPAEVFADNYGYSSRDHENARSLKRVKEEDTGLTHKTILLGDSGVGKTSLLVQFDTKKFQPGNFAATVGIGFTQIKITRKFQNFVLPEIQRRSSRSRSRCLPDGRRNQMERRPWSNESSSWPDLTRKRMRRSSKPQRQRRVRRRRQRR